jgi:uncharacterized membrane protein YfcA
MTTALLAVLTGAALLTSILSGMIGMGGGVVLLALMTVFLPLKLIIPIHGVVQLVSNISRASLLPSFINTRLLAWFAVGLPFGAYPAMVILKSVESETPFLIIIVVLILYAVFKPKNLPQLKLPMWGFLGIGAAVGFLSPLVGCTGPFLAPFFLRDDFSKEEIVASKAAVQVLGHLLKIPVFLHLGFDYLEYAQPILLMSLSALVGSKLGVVLLKRMSTTVFQWLFKVALTLAALRLVYKVWVS